MLVVVALTVSLAGSYVGASESQTVEETVVVVDASASMAAVSDGATRFDRALAEARSPVTGTTSVVVTGGEIRTVLLAGGPAEAGGRSTGCR